MISIVHVLELEILYYTSEAPGTLSCLEVGSSALRGCIPVSEQKERFFCTSNVGDFLIFHTCLALVARKKEVSCDILSLFGSLSLPKNVIELLYFE